MPATEPAPTTTVDVNGQRVVGAAPVPEPAPPEARLRTQADLDRETAEQRSAEARDALVGKATPTADPIAQAIAADRAELANPTEPVIPRGMETAPATATVAAAPRTEAPNATATMAVASPEPPAPHDYMAEYEANQARISAEQAEQPPTVPPTGGAVSETPPSNTDESRTAQGLEKPA